MDTLSHDCAPGSPSPVEHVDGVKAIAKLLGVALDEFRLFVAEVAASVSCLGVHEVDEREICRGQSGGARAMCVLRPTHLCVSWLLTSWFRSGPKPGATGWPKIATELEKVSEEDGATVYSLERPLPRISNGKGQLNQLQRQNLQRNIGGRS